MVSESKQKYKIPIITEIMEEKFIPLVSEVTHIIQIDHEICKTILF